MSRLRNPANGMHGDGDPAVHRAIDALTFGGQVPVDEIPRDRAARLLEIWAHRPSLTRTEVEAILARFPLSARKGKGHAWWSRVDPTGEQYIWTCTCTHTVVQAFGAPVPDELISHPQEHGQLRGYDLDER